MKNREHGSDDDIERGRGEEEEEDMTMIFLKERTKK